MKIDLKPKIETTKQFNMRLPQSLTQRLETLRTRANDYGADFNGTLVGVIEEFAAELEKRFAGLSNSASRNANKSVARPTSSNGSLPGEHPTDN